MADFTVSLGSSTRLNAQLERLARDVRERQKLARRLAGYVRTQARRNIKRQETVEGAPFSPRQRRKDARPMLAGLARAMAVRSGGEQGGAMVCWPNPLMSHIGFRHQQGLGEDWTPQRAETTYGMPEYAAPCTRRQAQALLREGYRLMVPAKGGGRRPKRVTVLWLQKHFSIGHAGLVLRILRTKDSRGAQRWQDTVPARPFLGVTVAEADKMCEKLAKTVLGGLTN